jgi:hypothetical protein
MAGLGFASGGTPVPGANPEVDEMLRGLAPRRGFADGGEAALMRKLYPWGAAGGLGGGTPGAGGAWSPGLTVKPQAPLGSGAQLKAPAPQPTGLSQTINAVERGLGAAENAEKLAKSGKKAYDWMKDQFKDPAASMEALATSTRTDQAATGEARGGRIGYDDGGAIDESPAIPGGGDDTVLGQLTKKQITPAKLPTRDLSGGAGGGGGGSAMGAIGAGLGAANSAVNIASSLSKMFAAHGGRIGYDEGGEVADAVATPPDLPVHKLDTSDSAGGGKKDTTAKDALGLAGTFANFIPGVGPAIGAGLKVASMFAKDGGRIGYAEGGGQTFVDRLMPAALKASEKTGVHPHLILAQAALESGWGKHAPGNNYFGIKGPGQVLDTKEQGATGLYNTRDSFRKYESPEHSVDDYANFIMSNSRYRPVREARTLDEQIEAMGRSGYATDRDYTAKLRGIANSLSGNATPFTPSERGRSEAPRSAGLAPLITDVEDLNEAPPPVEPNDDFEMFNNFEMPVRFATGGLVPRRGYQTGGGYLPRRDYQTASEEGVPSGASEEDLQRELQRGLREEPFARSTGLGGLNLPQHQLPALGTEGSPTSISIPPRSVPPAERTRDDRDLSGYNPPGSAPAVAPPLASRNVATVGGNNPPAVTPVVAGGPSTAPQAQTAAGLAPPVGAPGGSSKPPEDRDFFDRAGDWAGRNQNWLLPAVSGIGKMLASPSPYLGVAIGQGLAEGAQTGLGASFKQQSLDTQQQSTDASTMAQLQRAYEYMQRMADVERANNNGQVSAATASNLAAIQKQIMAFAGLGSPRSAGRRSQEEPQGAPQGAPQDTIPGDQTRVGTPVSGGNAPPTGTGAAPAFPNTPRTPIAADYTTTESGVPVDKMNNPAYLRSIAATMSTPEERNRYLEMARVIETTGVVTDINGARGIAKGWPEMQRQQQAVVSNQEWQRKEADASNERQTIIRSYGLLEKALQQVDTNPAAVVTSNIKEGARALGFVVPDGMSSAAAVQEITKQVAARAAQAGSDRARGMLQDGSIEAIKNPEANKQILAQLYADIDAAESRYKYIDDKINTTPTGNFSTWQQEWNRANPPNKFQDEAYNRLGVIGATPLDDAGVPDPTRMKVGAFYVLKPDEYWRTMKGTVPRDSIRGNVRVKVVEQNGQKGFIVQ